jgi:simple sugar transport system permease protein
MRERTTAWLTTIGALIGALLLCAAFIALAGQNPLVAGKALLQGATGVELQLSPFHLKFSMVRLTESLVRTIPLIMTGLSVAIAFRAGFFNIGAEGQMLIGGLTCAAIGTKLGLPVPFVLLGGALAGACWALIAGLLKTRRGAPEIITTIMLNYIALREVEFFV